MRLLRSPFFLVMIAVEALLVAGVHVVFWRIEEQQAKAVATVIGSLLRDESTMSRSYLLAQSIEDMQALGSIRCAVLSREVGGAVSIFYDSTFKQSCPLDSLVAVNLPGLDGHVWTLKVSQRIDSSFYLMKWIALAFATILAVLTYLTATALFETQKRRADSIETRRKFLEDLANQVRHDVASPLSALRVIAERAPLDLDTRNFLKAAVARTQSIFDSLKQNEARHQTINLKSELEIMVKEKSATNAKFPEVRFIGSEAGLAVPRVEFSRMISNILDNANESGARDIEIESRIASDRLTISIRDDGAPIPQEVGARLGQRGNTIGKASGSGLGLAHAFHFMRSLGGDLEIGCGSDPKIILKFPRVLSFVGSEV